MGEAREGTPKQPSYKAFLAQKKKKENIKFEQLPNQYTLVPSHLACIQCSKKDGICYVDSRIFRKKGARVKCASCLTKVCSFAKAEEGQLGNLEDWLASHILQDDGSTTLNEAVSAIEKDSSVVPGSTTSTPATDKSTSDNLGPLKRPRSETDPLIPGTGVSRQTKVARPETVTPAPSVPIATLDQNNVPGFYRSMIQALHYHQVDMKKARAVAAKDNQLQGNLASKNDVLEKRFQAEKIKVAKLERERKVAEEMAQTEKEKRDRVETEVVELKNARDTAEIELKAVKSELETDKRRMEDLELQLASMKNLKEECRSADSSVVANYWRIKHFKAQEALHLPQFEQEGLTAESKGQRVTPDQLQAATDIPRRQNGRLIVSGADHDAARAGFKTIQTESFIMLRQRLLDQINDLARRWDDEIKERNRRTRIAEDRAKDSKKARKAARKATQRAHAAEVAYNVVESNYISTKMELHEANKEIERLKKMIEDTGVKEE